MFKQCVLVVTMVCAISLLAMGQGEINKWIDVGQPSELFDVKSLQVYNGELYAGLDDANIYKFDGKKKWIWVGKAGTSGGIYVMHVCNGALFAGQILGKVYRYDGNLTWTYVGNPGSNDHVFSMAAFNNRLYVGTWGGQVFRYNGGVSWSWVGFAWDGQWTNALVVHNNRLYAGRADGVVYRYNGGSSWTDLSYECHLTQVGDLISYNNNLYAADFWNGLIDKRVDFVDPPWFLVGALESGVRRNCMCECQDKLYAGTTLGHLFRYDGPNTWKDLGSPIVSGSGAIEAVVEFEGLVFVTGNFGFNGHVYAYKP